MKTRLTIAAIALVGTLAATSAFALEQMWELDVTTDHPQFVRTKTPSDDTTFWYVTYTVHNQLDEPKTITPKVTLTDNMGHILHDRYQPDVLEQVKRRTGLELKNISNNAATLQPDEKLKAVAVFPMPDHEASTLTVEIYGIANRRVQTENDTVGIASRTYTVRYYINGDRHNFTPNRLETQSKGYVSTFRPFDQEGKTLDQAPDAQAIKLNEAAGAAPVKLVADEPAAPPVGAVAENPLALLPEGLKGIGYIDLKAIATTAIFKELIKNIPAEELGDFNPEQDLTAAAIAITSLTEDEPRGAVVVFGKFGDDVATRIKETAGPGAESVTYGGYKLFEKAEEDQLVGLLDPTTFVGGTRAVVRGIIDVRTGKTAPGKNTALLAQAADVRTSNAWFTTALELPPLPEESKMMLPGLDSTKVKTLSIGLNIADNVALKLIAGCADEDTATAALQGIRNSMNMFGMMAGTMLGEDPDAMIAAQDLLKSIKIRGKGTSAILELKISPDLIDALKKAGASFTRHRRR